MNREEVDLWYKHERDSLNQDYLKAIQKGISAEKRKNKYLTSMRKLRAKYDSKIVQSERLEQGASQNSPGNSKLDIVATGINTAINKFIIKPLLFPFTLILSFLRYVTHKFGFRLLFLRRILTFVSFWRKPAFVRMRKLFRKSHVHDISQLQILVDSFLQTEIYRSMQQDVLTIESSSTLKDAYALLDQQDHSTLVVVEHHKPVGKYAERAVLQLDPMAPDYNVKIAAVARPVKVVSPLLTYTQAIDHFIAGESKLIAFDSAIRGIFTPADLISEFVHFFSNKEIVSKNTTTVKEIMSTTLPFCAAGTKLADARLLMLKYSTDYLFVQDNNQIVLGIFTCHNYRKEFLRDPKRLFILNVENVMSSPVAHVSPHDSILDALHLFHEKSYQRLLVSLDTTTFGVLEREKLLAALTHIG